MKTRNPSSWSELPRDLFESIFKRLLSFTDFHRAKIVCSNWNSISKLTVPTKLRSPWLMLFPEGYDDSCVQLYNPEEDKIYRTKRDFSGIWFLGNWGNWFLVIDSRSNLYIIDVFSDNTINLPPLESLQSSVTCTLKRLGDKLFQRVISCEYWSSCANLSTDVLRGLLWVDEETKEYVVVLLFDVHDKCVFFCKKGDDHYTNIQVFTSSETTKETIYDVVLRGHSLYILSDHKNILFIDLSGPRGFQDVSWSRPFVVPSLYYYPADCHIIGVNTSGEVSLVLSMLDNTTIDRQRTFRVFKQIACNKLKYYFEVGSLGDEALLLGTHIFVPSIEPNSIYITSEDRVCHSFQKPLKTDIGVFNYETKTLKRFPSLSNMKLKDARWFLHWI